MYGARSNETIGPTCKTPVLQVNVSFYAKAMLLATYYTLEDNLSL